MIVLLVLCLARRHEEEIENWRDADIDVVDYFKGLADEIFSVFFLFCCLCFA